MDERFKVLVIDDDQSIRTTMAAILENEGYLVETAKDGKEAIDKSNADLYRVALIDFRLPDMEGTELLTALKETVPSMVKIIVTGYPSLPNAIEAVKRGADDYLVKPFKMENVLDTIKQRLKKQQEERRYSEEKVKEFIETRAREGDLE